MHKILVVEDNMIIALVTRRTLEKAGFEVLELVCNGNEAIELARKEQPDLILMDIQLDNGDDGIETMLEIRKFSQSPVIFLTGDSEEKAKKKANFPGIYGFLIKPVQTQTLLDLVNWVIHKKKQKK